MNKKIKIIILSVLAVIFLFSLYKVISISSEYRSEEKEYSKIQNEFVKKSENTDKLDVNEDKNDEEQVIEHKSKTPIDVDFDALIRQNSDVVGWIYCEDTPINYPVVKGKNNSFYLRRGLDKKYLGCGTLFADCRCLPINEDANFIIYGHHMKSHSMFGSLTNYKKQSYYNKHPVLYYLTPDAEYKIEVCEGLIVDELSEIYEVGKTTDKMKDFLEQNKSLSTFKAKFTVSDNDKFVTLSTCSYEYENARYVLIGKLIEL